MKKFILCLCSLSPLVLFGQTIKEKRESFHQAVGESGPMEKELKVVNDLLLEKHSLLRELYDKGKKLYSEKASTEDMQTLINEIAQVKREIREVEKMWSLGRESEDSYALWHQPETTLLSLVMDYGQEAIYIVPPEIGSLHLSISSTLPLPRESFGDCLKIIFEKNGVGIRDLSPFVKELFFLTEDITRLEAILSKPEELDLFSDEIQVCYIFKPDYADPNYTLNFLKKFSNPAITTFEMVRGDIFIISNPAEIRELLKLDQFMKKAGHEAKYKLITLSKIDAKDILSVFETAFPKENDSGIKIVTLANLPKSLFFIGSKNEIERAERIIEEIESQIDVGSEKVLFWYTVKHTEAEELACILAKVYDAYMQSKGASEGGGSSGSVNITQIEAKAKEELTVHTPQVGPASYKAQRSHKTQDGKNNFIVDPKSGALIMVVENDALAKIKELLKRLDQPKRMVQLEVLLFEKRLKSQNQAGINLLRIGDKSSNLSPDKKPSSGIGFGEKGLGILEFVITKGYGGSLPAFDLAFRFLMEQENLQITSSPSVITMNQTPAFIGIVNEMSLNSEVTNKDDKSKTSYSRAQYGTTITITPTINFDEESEQGKGYITLETDINFDTTKDDPNNRPNVTRRQIKNHVRVADGETVILGGLRSKNREDASDSVPFLGEIPGLGKLFSWSDLKDDSTEMYVFITPKIVSDSLHEVEKVRKEQLSKRPGETPEFLDELIHSREKERKKLFQQGLTALFGRSDDDKASFKRPGEYEGK